MIIFRQKEYTELSLFEQRQFVKINSRLRLLARARRASLSGLGRIDAALRDPGHVVRKGTSELVKKPITGAGIAAGQVVDTGLIAAAPGPFTKAIAIGQPGVGKAIGGRVGGYINDKVIPQKAQQVLNNTGESMMDTSGKTIASKVGNYIHGITNGAYQWLSMPQ